MNFLNKNTKIKYYNEPYPFVVIEDFFEKNFYDNIEKNFQKSQTFSLKKIR